MPTTHDLERRPIVHRRAHIALARRDLGEGREDVEERDPRADPLQPPDRRPHARAQRLEELPLERLGALGRMEHLLLELLEGRRHIPFGTGQRLAALILGGHVLPIGVRDLDVVPEHAVVADLERRDAGAHSLFRLQRGDRILAPAHDRAQVVERGIHALSDRLAIAVRKRRARDERGPDLGGEVRGVVPRRADTGKCAAARRSTQRARDLRQAHERIAERAQVARRGAAGRGLATQALDVTHAIERVTQRGARERVAQQRLHRIETRRDRHDVRERREDPLPEQARAHRRLRAIKHAEQRAAGIVRRAERFHQFEIAARHLVERHDAARTLKHGAREVRNP